MGHWRHGTRLAQLPAELRPKTRQEGYAIQARLAQQSSAPLFGWKIAATSAAGQQHINVDGPLAGRILAETVLEDGATVSLANSNMRVAEVELAFRLGADLAPRREPFSPDEVMAAVAGLHPTIEIPDSRYNDFCSVGAAQLIADNSCANLLILGPEATDGWRTLDLAEQPVCATVLGRSEHHGKGANVLGDPRVALQWIVNELSALGVIMRAGEVITTGTCTVPIQVEPGDQVRAKYGALGSLHVSFV